IRDFHVTGVQTCALPISTRLIAERLGLSEKDYTVCFQSRLNDKWLRPFSDQVVEDCAKKGMKKILVFSPAFTADCLETIVEIGRSEERRVGKEWRSRWGR